ncbi:hypothetical protein CLV63_1411, partial [Murinocardiopsis flavida]
MERPPALTPTPGVRGPPRPSGRLRTVIDLEVDEIGPSLRWATAQVTKTTNGGRGR